MSWSELGGHTSYKFDSGEQLTLELLYEIYLLTIYPQGFTEERKRQLLHYSTVLEKIFDGTTGNVQIWSCNTSPGVRGRKFLRMFRALEIINDGQCVISYDDYVYHPDRFNGTNYLEFYTRRPVPLAIDNNPTNDPDIQDLRHYDRDDGYYYPEEHETLWFDPETGYPTEEFFDRLKEMQERQRRSSE